jgi:hypothetical protein
MICKKNKDNTMVVQLCTFWMGHLELILSKLKDCNVDWVKVNREKKKMSRWKVWKKGDPSRRSITSQPTTWEGENLMSKAQKKLIEISQKDLEAPNNVSTSN